MNGSKTWAASICVLLMAVGVAISAIDNENSLTLTSAAFFLVMSFLVKPKFGILPFARYIAAALFAITAVETFARVETPFPFMVEIWGDLPKADIMNVLMAIQLMATVFILLDFQRYRIPTSPEPPSDHSTA